MSRLRPIALSLLGLSTGFAQNETPPAPGGVLIPPDAPRAPGAPPAPGGAGNRAAPPAPAIPPVPAPAGEPAGAQAIPLSERKITESILEPKLSGNALADLYSKYTGRRVIVTGAASLAEFSFVQTATPEHPITYAYAAELLRKAAILESFVFVPDATDPNLDYLAIATGGTNPKNIDGGKIYSESDTLPEGGQSITYVMNLQYLKADALVQVFQQIIGQFGAYGSIAVANPSSVVITENASLIRKLVEIKKEIDKPSTQVATRFISVEYADVTELATTLNDLLSAQGQQQQQTAGIQRAPAPNAPQVQGAEIAGHAGGGAAGEQTPVQIIPDPRTNRLFVMGRPIDILFVEGLVREFDTQTDQRNFLRRKLRFLKVSEFLPIARNALTRAFSGGDTAGGAGGGAAGGGGGGGPAGALGGANRSSNNRTSTSSTRNTSSTNSSSFGGGGGGSGSTSGIGGSGGSLSAPSVSTAPESDLVGRTLLVADNITNSIVIQGPPSALEIIERLLDEIDVKADQVMLSCVIGQLSLVDGYSFGMDYVYTLNGDIAGRGGSGAGGVVPLGPTVATPLATPPYFPGTLPASAGLALYGQIGNHLNAYLAAKQEDSNFKVLSRPTIFTANNQKGSIISGRQIAVPTNSYSSGVSTTSSTNYEYKDVAIQLEVVPLVNSKDEVTLQVFLTSDDVGANRQVGTGDTSYLIPDILKRELITTVTVPNKETIVLGGLIDEQTTDSRSGIPILNRMPLLGPLFGTKTKNVTRSELLVFIQPSIVHDVNSLVDAQVDMDTRYKTSGDTRKFADGPGVLPPPDGIPVNDKASTTTTKTRETIVVDPKAKPAGNYPHGTRFRSSPR